MKRKAFTLIETITVLAIIIIFFAISVPFFSGLTESAKLQGTARSISSALRTARGYAISNNADYYVFFRNDTTPNCYFISDNNIGTVPEDSAIEKVYKLPTGIDFSAVNFSCGTPAAAAHFGSNGALQESIHNPGSVIVSDGAHTITISVEWTTGRVRID